ncbi:hypothetical protein [Sporichthya sp.]|uniref:hypothetical protein n=1 Tax=Sporichthya sp. TaxID=65475 RepID=UPI0025CF0173|nr:hypothetical protein [Sporichthya sp.]
MNDAAFRCEWIVESDGRLANLNLQALHHDLLRTPNGAGTSRTRSNSPADGPLAARRVPVAAST